MEQENETVDSNIYDAISYMKKQIDHCESVMTGSRLRYLYNFEPYLTNALLVFAAPALISLFLIWLWRSIESDMDRTTLYIFCLLFLGILMNVFAKFTGNFRACQSARKKLMPILWDLEKLYEYDHHMNVGFQLDGQGHFVEPFLDTTMQERKKEISERLNS